MLSFVTLKLVKPYLLENDVFLSHIFVYITIVHNDVQDKKGRLTTIKEAQRN